MTEKLHYEVRLIETDDGFRLEATGDKEALKKLGIGPNMLNKKWRRHGRKHGMKRGREFGPRGTQYRPEFGPQGMERRRTRRTAMAQRRHAWHRHGAGRGRWHTSPEPSRRFRHAYGQEGRFGEKGSRGTPDYL